MSHPLHIEREYIMNNKEIIKQFRCTSTIKD